MNGVGKRYAACTQLIDKAHNDQTVEDGYSGYLDETDTGGHRKVHPARGAPIFEVKAAPPSVLRMPDG
jgi:hypothetical protein